MDQIFYFLSSGPNGIEYTNTVKPMDSYSTVVLMTTHIFQVTRPTGDHPRTPQ